MFRTERFIERWSLLALLLGAGLAPTPTNAAVKPPSLDELKAEGARKSRLKDLPKHAVSPKAPEPALGRFRKEVEPILKAHCVDCHGPEKAKASLRIDTLDPNLLEGKDVDWWLEILGTLGNGEMPPPDKSELPAKDRARAMDWLSGEISMASTARRASGEYSSFRRMTRYEYNHALQDLLGAPGDFERDLPPEAHSEDGFQNSSETLHMSVAQLETYRRMARKALLRATARGPRPAVLHWNVTMDKASRVDWGERTAELEKIRAKLKSRHQNDPEKLKVELDRLQAESTKPHRRAYFKERSTGRTAEHSWNYRRAAYAIKPDATLPEPPETSDRVAIIPWGQTLIVELGDKVPDEGTLRVRVHASRTSLDDRIPSLQLEFGWQASNEGRARLRVSKEDTPIAADPDKPDFYQWDVPLGDIYPRNSVRKTSALGRMPNPSEYIRLVNCSVSQGDIRIDLVEISAPVHAQWPPESHRRIFFESRNSDNEPVYAREILNRFISRAWRRNATAVEIGRKLRLFERVRKVCDTFEEAMIETLATVLSSPEFLYLVRDHGVTASDKPTGPQPLSGQELATRLSIFLWSSVPDDRLLELAGRGQLNRADVLEGEVKRMLADPRSSRFAQHFVHQWLDMQLLDFLKPGRELDWSLKQAMQREPILFFQETLKRNESVLNFIHADYTMANERLAQHYGLPGVHGNHFRRVKLNARHRRGGLLTQAGLLAMNSSGKESNPLKRGIWMLESLLNDPPPPPPPAVPEIDLADPRIAKMTLKERIQDHRNHPACMSCHVKIDPWGIAFENYGALGQWRERAKGRPVDATSRLFNNEPLNGMDGLKRFLLKNRQDQFVRAMAHKLTVYALGRPLSFADRTGVEEIAAEVRRQGDGLATLVTQVAMSELFRSK